MKLKDFLSQKIEIIFEPDERLRKVSPLYEEWDLKNLKQLKDKMYELMTSAQGIGLAAPQIGLNLRILLMLEIKENSRIPILVVNPQVLEKQDEACIEEGCLSIKDKRVFVKRAAKVKVKYFNENQQEQIRFFEGINAICIQHEIDHLDGILMTDYL